MKEMLCIDIYKKYEIKDHVVNEKLITIEVKGGCVINVSGMPEDYLYEIKDHDVVDDERKIYYA